MVRGLLVAAALILLAALTRLSLVTPPLGAWQLAASLEVPRTGHTATLLMDGRVLVAGGRQTVGGRGLDPIAVTELYNPEANRWSAGGPMSTARSNHSATRLSNGTVLVTGGEGPGGPPLRNSEIFDPGLDRWLPAPPMAHARINHSATLLQDGRVLVIGGEDAFGLLDSVEVYQPATGQWSAAAPMLTPRSGHSATRLPNGDVMVAGGQTWGPVAERWSPRSGRWSAVATTKQMNGGEHPGAQVSQLPTGWVLSTGGRGLHDEDLATGVVYDPTLTRSWPLPNLRQSVYGHTATLLQDGRVLVAGGVHNGQVTRFTEIYQVGGTQPLLSTQSFVCLRGSGCMPILQAAAGLIMAIATGILVLLAIRAARRRFLRDADPDAWLAT